MKENEQKGWLTEDLFVYLRIRKMVTNNNKIKVMRYTVKYIDGKNVVNAVSTNDLAFAVKEKLRLWSEMTLAYPNTQVWIVDAVEEIMVG